jgi:hypothetical protein
MSEVISRIFWRQMRSEQLCAGGVGGMGGNAHTGGDGEGGEGQVARLDLDPNEHYKIGNISGEYPPFYTSCYS